MKRAILRIAAVPCLLVLGCLLTGCGSFRTYPAFLDSPEFQTAAVEAFSGGAKNLTLTGGVSNPEVEFYWKTSFGARLIGVNTSYVFQAGAGPTTQPAPIGPTEKS